MFTKNDINLIIALLEAQKEHINLIRGFRKPTKTEQNENAYYNKLIYKIKSLKNK